MELRIDPTEAGAVTDPQAEAKESVAKPVHTGARLAYDTANAPA